MNVNFLDTCGELAKEKGISPDVLFDAIEAALISAYRRNFGAVQNVRVALDRTTGVFQVFSRLKVVEAIEDARQEITLEEAQKIDSR